MIQFNLLPDVKLEYIKAQRTKYLVSTISLLAGAGSIAVFVILVLTVNVWQHKTIGDLSGDIKTTSHELKATPDLDKILTVQGQLGSLSALHEGKPAAQRLFSYLSQVTPVTTTITDMTADFEENTFTITGKAPSLNVVNTFTDSLKFTKYQTANSDPNDPPSAFSSVVLSSFGRTQEGATYTITLNFEPTIFSNTEKVKLIVPKTTTTRSVVEQPDVLFDGTTETPTGEEQQ